MTMLPEHTKADRLRERIRAAKEDPSCPCPPQRFKISLNTFNTERPDVLQAKKDMDILVDMGLVVLLDEIPEVNSNERNLEISHNSYFGLTPNGIRFRSLTPYEFRKRIHRFQADTKRKQRTRNKEKLFIGTISAILGTIIGGLIVGMISYFTGFD